MRTAMVSAGDGVCGRVLGVNECCYRRRHAMGSASKGSVGGRVAVSGQLGLQLRGFRWWLPACAVLVQWPYL